jgi:hypothetical protein
VRKIQCKARAIPDSHDLGFSPEKGTPQVGIRVLVLDGEFEGQTDTWIGYFTEATEARTIEQLQMAGWDGVNIAKMDGLGSTEFLLSYEEETYKNETRWKPTFINRIGVQMKNSMNDTQRREFAALIRSRMGATAPRGANPRDQQRGSSRAHAARNSGPDLTSPPPGDDDINF